MTLVQSLRGYLIVDVVCLVCAWPGSLLQCNSEQRANRTAV
jgi:hypothetical protein